MLCFAPFGTRFRRRLNRNFAFAFSDMSGKLSNDYCQIEFLPKYAEHVAPCTLPTDTKDKEYAIVLQGPVLNEFTAETVKIYRKIFPKAAIIASTWKSTDEKLSDELKTLADEVILSDPPEVPGVGNVNYQVKSSYAGIRRAHELGIPYAVKTRVDQRIYNPIMFEYMKSLLEAYPLDSKYSQWQKERIIALQGGGIAEHYYISDYFYFGTTQDLLNFFDFPPDPATIARVSRPDMLKRWNGNQGGPSLCFRPEVELLKSYIMRFGGGGANQPSKISGTISRSVSSS